MDTVLTEFIESNLCNRSLVKRLFEIMKFVSKCCPQLFHDIVGQLNRTIQSVETKRNTGTDFILSLWFNIYNRDLLVIEREGNDFHSDGPNSHRGVGLVNEMQINAFNSAIAVDIYGTTFVQK
ncbi:unnamed protein product [Oppiella nova]|uniref:Uncharacterized protein n=1 Tax=Oppiella nova TaxID=334625 RepID=A0A7R9LPB8_9ACAR|nr:unnamed protein product [Oppiella nova]CAG2165632.1 unnamed protein product [Oppiella nova]